MDFFYLRSILCRFIIGQIVHLRLLGLRELWPTHYPAVENYRKNIARKTKRKV